MARRAWGSGSQYTTKAGQHVALDRRPDGTIVRGTSRRSMAEARARLKAKLRVVPSATPSTHPETVAEYLERWRRDVARHRVRPRTLERYGYAHALAVPIIGHIALDELTPDDVQDVMNAVLRSGRAPQTAKHVHTALRSALRDAEKRGLVPRNVAALVDAVRVPVKPVVRLSAEQVKAFLAAGRTHPHYPIWVLALTTGMRRGEVLSLRWSDVDLPNARLTIAGTLRRVSRTAWDFEEPKTDRARRTLSLSRMAVAALTEQRKVATSAVLVFARANGQPLEPSWVTHTFQDALVAAKLPSIPFHAMRHTAAALMLDSSGGDLRLVMSALGHANIGTTVDRYGGIAEQAMRKAADAMDDVLGEETV
jgi:integrase